MSLKRLLVGTWYKYHEHNTPSHAAALAYYTLFAIFPIILLMTSILGYVMSFGGERAFDVRHFVITSAQVIFPTLRGSIVESMQALVNARGVSGVVGVVTLLWSASHVFSQLHLSFDEMFGYLPGQNVLVATIRGRLFAMGLVLLLALLLFASLFLTTLYTGFAKMVSGLPAGGPVWQNVSLVLSMAILAVVITAMYRLIPSCPVSTRAALLGGIFTAVTWKIGQVLLAWYIVYNNFDAVYGAIGSVLALMVWVYYSSQMLFVGAAFTATYDYLEEAARRGEPQIVPEQRRYELRQRLAQPRTFLSGVFAGVVLLAVGFVTTLFAALRRVTRRFHSPL